MPLFTVAIPTYNRAHYLRYTLSCLLQQTYADFDIVISDNASTDGTAEVVRGFEDKRIHFSQQATHVSAAENWAACAEAAKTEWIVFNQDDDVLCPEFLERCSQAIHKAPQSVMYAANTMIAGDISSIHNGGSFCGVPLRHHWDQPQPRLIPGVEIAALAWFVSPFCPPALAMPTQLFRKHWPRGPDAPYLGEHYLVSRIACEGTVAYEGYIGAIMREHADRVYRTAPDVARRLQQAPFVALAELFAEKEVDWQEPLRAITKELSLSYREWLLNHYLFNEFIAAEALEIIAASVANDKNLPAANYVEDLRMERLKPAPVGRLDRWGVPKPIRRVIRGLLFAAGKDY